MTTIIRHTKGQFSGRIGQDRAVSLYRSGFPFVAGVGGSPTLPFPDGSEGAGRGVLYEVVTKREPGLFVSRNTEYLAMAQPTGSNAQSLFKIFGPNFYVVTNVHFQIKGWLMNFDSLQSYDDEKADPHMNFRLGLYFDRAKWLSDNCAPNQLKGSDSPIFVEELSTLEDYKFVINFGSHISEGINAADPPPPDKRWKFCGEYQTPTAYGNAEFRFLIRFEGRHSEQIEVDESAWPLSSSTDITLLEDFLPSPLSFTANVDDRDDRGVRFTWQTVEFAEGYDLYVNGKNHGLLPQEDHWSTSYEMSGLEIGRVYNAYVVAVKGDVRSGSSRQQEFEVYFPAPEGVSVEIDGNNVTIQWDDVQYADGYNLFLNGEQVNKIGLISNSQYTFDLANGDYECYVVAVHKGHESPVSDTVAFDKWVVGGKPPAPENLTSEVIEVGHAPENFTAELIVAETPESPENFTGELIDNADLIPDNFTAGFIDSADLILQNFKVESADKELTPKNFTAENADEELTPKNFTAEIVNDELTPKNFITEITDLAPTNFTAEITDLTPANFTAEIADDELIPKNFTAEITT